MKKIICLLLFIGLIFLSYLLINTYNSNKKLKEDIEKYELKLVDNQKEYNEKKQLLESLKEEKKDKVQRLEDLEVWNQEVVKYLD